MTPPVPSSCIDSASGAPVAKAAQLLAHDVAGTSFASRETSSAMVSLTLSRDPIASVSS